MSVLEPSYAVKRKNGYETEGRFRPQLELLLGLACLANHIVVVAGVVRVQGSLHALGLEGCAGRAPNLHQFLGLGICLTTEENDEAIFVPPFPAALSGKLRATKAYTKEMHGVSSP